MLLQRGIHDILYVFYFRKAVLTDLPPSWKCRGPYGILEWPRSSHKKRVPVGRSLATQYRHGRLSLAVHSTHVPYREREREEGVRACVGGVHNYWLSPFLRVLSLSGNNYIAACLWEELVVGSA